MFSDDNSIELLTLLDPILKEPKFKSIPIMAINDFCRGNGKVEIVDLKGLCVSRADFIFLFPTANGYPTFLHEKAGSHFIQELCHEFKTTAREIKSIEQEC